METKNRSEQTALLSLCSRDTMNLRVLGLLLSSGANPNSIDEQRNTALHIILKAIIKIMQESPTEMSHFAGLEEVRNYRLAYCKETVFNQKIAALHLLVGYGARTDLINDKGE